MSLDFLGAVMPSQHSKDRANASGQRAVTAAQKIAKTAPQLAAAIAKAGQKALAAGGGKAQATSTSVPTPAPATAPTQQPAPRAQPRPVRQSLPAPAHRAPMARIATPPGKRGAHVGDDAPAQDEQIVDVYAQLADTASGVADFMGQIQDILNGLPPTSPLVEQGKAVISQLENWFGNPLEAALQGDQQALAKTGAIAGMLQSILANQSDSNRPWPWAWIANANAYMQMHPPPKQDSGTTATDGTTTQPGAPPIGTVAHVSVLPKGMALAVGTPQLFTAQTLDAGGQVISPKTPVTWAVSGLPTAAPAMPTQQPAYPGAYPGMGAASIDQGGNFISQAPGNYTVTATADGVTGSALALVQASMQAPGATPAAGGYAAGGGSGGGGGGFSGGGGGYSPPDDGGGYADYPADDGQGGGDQGYADDQGGQQDQYAGGGGDYQDQGDGRDQIGQALAYLGGGHGGGHGHGGHGHHHGGGRGRRNNDGGTIGPWFYGFDGIDVDEFADADDIAEALAQKLKKKSALGLDCLGATWALSHIGDISDTVTDYDYGEKQVLEMRTFFNSLGKPGGFQPAVDGLNAAYDNAKAWEPLGTDKLLRWKHATEMKQVGADASRLMAEMQGAHKDKAIVAPSSGKSAVYDPTTKGPLDWAKDNWPWLVGGGVAIMTLPAILPPLIGAIAMARSR